MLFRRHAIAAPRHQRERTSVRHRAPLQRWKFVCPMHVEPCGLLRWVTVSPLLDVAGPAATHTALPSTRPRRARQAERGPRIAVCRVLQHPPPRPHGPESRLEAPAIVASLVPPPRFDEPSETAPSRAWGMSHDRVRPVVAACITLLVPRIDAIETVVRTALLDVECGDHRPAASSASQRAIASSRSVKRSCR